ncbi:hypothetical protein ACWD0Z_27660 [Streptomyces sp. NPDC003007]
MSTLYHQQTKNLRTSLPNDFTSADGRKGTDPERAELPNHAAPVVCR